MTDASQIAQYQPWKAPWWRPGRGDGPTFFWMVVIHLGAVAVAAARNLVSGTLRAQRSVLTCGQYPTSDGNCNCPVQESSQKCLSIICALWRESFGFFGIYIWDI